MNVSNSENTPPDDVFFVGKNISTTVTTPIQFTLWINSTPPKQLYPDENIGNLETAMQKAKQYTNQNPHVPVTIVRTSIVKNVVRTVENITEKRA